MNQPYITIAQAQNGQRIFRPVSIDAAGRINSLPVYIQRNTLDAVIGMAHAFAAKYRIQFSPDLAQVQPEVMPLVVEVMARFAAQGEVA